MSQHKTTTEIDRMITGIEVQEAVNLTVAYIRKTQKHLHSPEAAHGYWAGLTNDEKIDILKKALTR